MPTSHPPTTGGLGPLDGAGAARGGQRRARSQCRFVLPVTHFIPDSLTYSVPIFLKRRCDRTLGQRAPGAVAGDGGGGGVAASRPRGGFETLSTGSSAFPRARSAWQCGSSHLGIWPQGSVLADGPRELPWVPRASYRYRNRRLINFIPQVARGTV